MNERVFQITEDEMQHIKKRYANPISVGQPVRAFDWNEIRAFVVALEAL